MSAISSLSFEEHAEALQAKDRLLDALRNMSSGIRSDARSLDDIMAPGRAVAREQRAQSIFKELSTARCSHRSFLELYALLNLTNLFI